MKLVIISLIAAITSAVSAIDINGLLRTSLVPPETIAKHKEHLGLSSEQEAKLRTITEAAQQQAPALETAVRTEQSKLEDLVKDAASTPDQAGEQLKKLMEAEAALKQLQLRTLISMRAELSPEQTRKAVSLMKKDAKTEVPVEENLKSKADKLKAAFDELGVKPNEALQAKGANIEQMIRSGDLANANKALDDLIAETGLNAPVSTDKVDFDKFEPGNTDLDTLRSRYDSVTEQAKTVISLPTLRLLIQGRDELEKAKAAEDAVRVARILTWAEGVLANK